MRPRLLFLLDLRPGDFLSNHWLETAAKAVRSFDPALAVRGATVSPAGDVVVEILPWR